jgi:hypothetical protein
MATGGLHPILRFIRELVRLDDSGDRADAEVVERFAAYGGEAAFAAIVERHGPMVFGDELAQMRIMRDRQAKK